MAVPTVALLLTCPKRLSGLNLILSTLTTSTPWWELAELFLRPAQCRQSLSVISSQRRSRCKLYRMLLLVLSWWQKETRPPPRGERHLSGSGIAAGDTTTTPHPSPLPEGEGTKGRCASAPYFKLSLINGRI